MGASGKDSSYDGTRHDECPCSSHGIRLDSFKHAHVMLCVLGLDGGHLVFGGFRRSVEIVGIIDMLNGLLDLNVFGHGLVVGVQMVSHDC